MKNPVSWVSRFAVVFMAGFFMGKGWLTTDQISESVEAFKVFALIVGPLATIGGLAWSASANSWFSILKAASEKADIVVLKQDDAKLAQKLPENVVVKAE